jgi:hypothetical protein
VSARIRGRFRASITAAIVTRLATTGHLAESPLNGLRRAQNEKPPADLEQVHHPDDEKTADREKQKFGTADSRHGCAPPNGWQDRALAGERALVGLGAEVKFRATKRQGSQSLTHRQEIL